MDEREFSTREALALCLGLVGVQLATQIINQWGVYFYSPSQQVGRIIYVNIAIVSWIFIIGTIWNAVTDPIVGFWSDMTRTRPGLLRLIPVHGRRRPFIFWGSILMVFTSIAFWYPPVPETSKANFVYGLVMLCLHWTVFTITVIPINALGPEIARSERERVRLGVWIAVGLIVGLVMAIVLPGKLITLLDPARAQGAFSPVGYRRVATFFAVLALALLQLPVWFIRERYDSEAIRHKRLPALAEIRSAAGSVVRNRRFIVYSIVGFEKWLRRRTGNL